MLGTPTSTAAPPGAGATTIDGPDEDDEAAVAAAPPIAVPATVDGPDDDDGLPIASAAPIALPAAARPPAPPAQPVTREPLRVRVTSDEDSSQLVDLVLSVAADLTLEDEMVLVNAAEQERPAAELLGKFFAAAASPEHGLLASEDGGSTLLPPQGPAGPEVKVKAATFGRLLGYAACHAITVPLPLSAAFFFFMTARDELTDDVGRALCLLAGYDPRRAHELRCQLAKRMGHSATLSGVLANADATDVGLSDASKGQLAVEAVRQLLVGRRRETFTAMRDGLEALLGSTSLLSALKPWELAYRLLGWEPQPCGVDCNFEEDDWEDTSLLAAYADWLSQWATGLSPSERCALRLFLAGSAGSPAVDATDAAPMSSRTSVLCAAGAQAHFLPETCQLYVPVACSAEEFNERMYSSIA